MTSCADDGSPGTLRKVVASAHDGDTIDLTQLTCSTITLRLGGIDMHSTSGLTFNGPGQDRLTISGGGVSPVLHADFYSYALTLRDMTLAHGYAGWNLPNFYYASGCLTAASADIVLERVTITDCKTTSTHSYDRGGAVVGGFLSLIDSTVSHSSIRYDHFAVQGGGIWANGASLIHSTVSDNAVIGDGTASANVASGGGLFVGGILVMVDSTVSGNLVQAPSGYDTAGDQATGGGGIYSAGGPLVLINSTVSGNSVEATNPGEDGVGGGIFSRSIATIVGSTISGNTADGDGGGIYKRPFGLVFDNQSTLTIQNSTITGNSAGGTGGGVLSQRPAWIANSTIAGNQSALGGALMFTRTGGYPDAGVLDLESTIIAGNTAGPTPTYALDLATDDVLAVTGSHSLVMDAAAGIVLPPDTLQTDPLLLPLADNGGLVWTMALAPGSPAIDAGSNPLGLQADARGSPWLRTFSTVPDIGAYEVQPPPDPIFANGFDP